jgi:hypothetical protein
MRFISILLESADRIPEPRRQHKRPVGRKIGAQTNPLPLQFALFRLAEIRFVIEFLDPQLQYAALERVEPLQLPSLAKPPISDRPHVAFQDLDLKRVQQL